MSLGARPDTPQIELKHYETHPLFSSCISQPFPAPVSFAKPHVTHDPPFWRKNPPSWGVWAHTFATCHIFIQKNPPPWACVPLVLHTSILPLPKIILALALVCSWLSTRRKLSWPWPWCGPATPHNHGVTVLLSLKKILSERHVSCFGRKKILRPGYVWNLGVTHMPQTIKKNPPSWACVEIVCYIFTDFYSPPPVFFDKVV